MKFVQGIPSFQGEIPSPSRKEGQSEIQESPYTMGVEERKEERFPLLGAAEWY